MAVKFLDVKDGQCRFPLWNGDDELKLVCADPVQGESSYCAEHHKRCRYAVPASRLFVRDHSEVPNIMPFGDPAELTEVFA